MSEVPAILAALRAEHLQIATLLGLIEREVDHLERRGKADIGLLAAIVRYLALYPDRYHHPKEDLVYACLRARDPGAAAAIGKLAQDHVDLGAATRRLAARLEGAERGHEVPPATLGRECRALLGRYHDHMTREESDLFPHAQRALRPADWARIERDAASREDPLFGPNVEAAFQPIHDALMRRSWLRA